MSSTPSLTKFNPHDVPYQYRVICDVRAQYDYGKGAHEVLLSGSIGCLREDALVETISGATPIANIGKKDFVLSFSHHHNRYVFAQGTDAYPKGKDYLYRVIGEHGEFVASGNHLLATSHGNYLPVSSLVGNHASTASFLAHDPRYLSSSRKSYYANVLHYSGKVSSLIKHYAERIHQYGPQLREDLKTVLDAFPLQDDAQEFGQFSYRNRLGHTDDLEALELRLSRNAAIHAHQSMMGCGHLSVPQMLALEDEDFGSTLSEHILVDNQLFLQFLSSNDHPTVLLFFLYKLCKFLVPVFAPLNVDITHSRILSIEKLKEKEWYWDVQIPNSNNYIGSGLVHHNSAKSILMAHVIVTHCLFYPKARFCIGRRALPDLKATLYQKILEHIDEDMVEGRDYKANDSTGYIQFSNGSEIISRSWADKNFKKMRSLELSGVAIEELTEHEDNQEAYKELSMRVNRLPHVPEQIIIAATNPDGKGHWAYKYFIENESPTRHVYYSVTTDNPFLPASYISKLKEDLDPKMVQRMIYGQWVDIAGETIYYQYDPKIHFKRTEYKVSPVHPVYFSFDFNVGEGKPMSVVFFQYINDHFHFFDEVVVSGARTQSTLEEIYERGLFSIPCTMFMACGDASGKANSANSNMSNYETIESFLKDKKVKHQMCYLPSNPPIKRRHNLVNGYLKNSEGKVRVTVYNKAKTLDEGLKLVKLKPGGSYIEDDSKPYQHITTAAGYGMNYCWASKDMHSSHIQL